MASALSCCADNRSCLKGDRGIGLGLLNIGLQGLDLPVRILDVALLLRGGVFAELLVRSKADLLFLLHLHSLRAHVLKHADNLLDRARAVTERVSRGEGQRQQNTMPHLSCKDGL